MVGIDRSIITYNSVQVILNNILLKFKYYFRSTKQTMVESQQMFADQTTLFCRRVC